MGTSWFLVCFALGIEVGVGLLGWPGPLGRAGPLPGGSLVVRHMGFLVLHSAHSGWPVSDGALAFSVAFLRWAAWFHFSVLHGDCRLYGSGFPSCLLLIPGVGDGCGPPSPIVDHNSCKTFAIFFASTNCQGLRTQMQGRFRVKRFI